MDRYGLAALKPLHIADFIMPYAPYWTLSPKKALGNSYAAISDTRRYAADGLPTLSLPSLALLSGGWPVCQRA